MKQYIWIGIGVLLLVAAGVFAWLKFRKKDNDQTSSNPATTSPTLAKPILYFDDDLGRFIRMKLIDSNKKTYSFAVFRGVNLTNVVIAPYRVDVVCAGTKATIKIHQNADLLLTAILDTTTYDIQLS